MEEQVVRTSLKSDDYYDPSLILNQAMNDLKQENCNWFIFPLTKKKIKNLY